MMEQKKYFKLMKEKECCSYVLPLQPVMLCSNTADGKKELIPNHKALSIKKKSFQLALQAGVTICMGGDVGVFTHGDNAREMELMVEYGMKPIDVLKSSTSINADVFGYGNKIGRIKKDLFADIIAVEGDPSADIKNIRKIKLVMKDGVIYKKE